MTAVALYYDPDGYTETVGPGRRSAGGPMGLMGRQVAGKEFLDAYLTHGRWDALTAVVRTRGRADPLVRLCQSHPSSRTRRRRLHIVAESEFPTADRPADVLHLPHPPDARFAWRRRSAAPLGFALCGVAHTLATPAAVQALCELVVAPFESFDALVCTSQAVADLVRAVTGSFADYLNESGGTMRLRPRLPVIPLGVNPDTFRPATAAERETARTALGVRPDEKLLLCVGRLSHHAKAHPYPAFHAADQAAKRTGRPVHLLFAGWAANPAVARAYQAAARAFAPAARVSFADGQNPGVRSAVWAAADVFVSLPDNVQETFGLVVVEAMASGLPVVGSDWDGYRDLIADAETGYLVPTRAVAGATAGLETAVETGGISYDRFLAGCVQTVAVDPAAAADAVTKLVAEADLRRRFGAAGRDRVMRRFTWEGVIRQYETLWAEQAGELAAVRTAGAQTRPGKYPPLDVAFAGYPSAWVTATTRVIASAHAVGELALFADTPLTNMAGERRATPAATADALRAAIGGITVGDLTARLEAVGTPPTAARATVGWLLKYGLLRVG